MNENHPNGSNLAGRKFGLLTALERCGKTVDGHIKWSCICDCGTASIAASNSLKSGQKKSCGCLRAESAKKRIKRDGVWNDGKSYAIGGGNRCYKTKHSWAKAVIRHYGNKCQKCGWDKGRCDAHHKKMKSAGGLHTIENGEVLCPNCHRIEHEVSP